MQPATTGGSPLFKQTPLNKAAFLEANPPAAPRLDQPDVRFPGSNLEQPAPAQRMGEATGLPLVPPSPQVAAQAGTGGGESGLLQGPSAPPASLPDPLSPFLQATETSPELAAFKALLEAPAPVFQKAGFTMAERVALGFLAGLRGIEAVEPIIEARRQEARAVYQDARMARAERLEGLYRVAELTRQQGMETHARGVEAQRLGFEERRVATGEKSAASIEALRQAQMGRAALGRPLPAATVTDLGKAIGVASEARRFVRGFKDAGQPGGPISTLGGNVAFTTAQQVMRADLQGTTGRMKTDLIGSARTLTELQDISCFLPSFGDRDSTIIIGMNTVAQHSIAAVRAKIASLKAAGFDTSGQEALLEKAGYTGIEVAAPLMPLPPGLSYDPTFSLMEEQEF